MEKRYLVAVLSAVMLSSGCGGNSPEGGEEGFQAKQMKGCKTESL